MLPPASSTGWTCRSGLGWVKVDRPFFVCTLYTASDGFKALFVLADSPTAWELCLMNVLWTYFWQPFDNFVSVPSGLEICVVSWPYVCTDKESEHSKSSIVLREMALRTCVRGENFIRMMKATHFHRLIVTTPRSMSRLSQPGRDQDTERDARERSRSVTSFYFQSAIDQAAAKVSNALFQMYGVCMSRCLSQLTAQGRLFFLDVQWQKADDETESFSAGQVGKRSDQCQFNCCE